MEIKNDDDDTDPGAPRVLSFFRSQVHSSHTLTGG